MALINCSECNREVSDKASSCPGCGCPIKMVAAARTVTPNLQPQQPEVVTTQLTSKDLKGHVVGGVITMIFGLFLMFYTIGSDAGRVISMIVMAVGVVWVIYAKTASWWHHG